MIMAALSLLATQESSTTTYRYDAIGRLVAAETSNGTELPTASKISYDKADNRISYEVTGAWAKPQFRAMVLPINGFTVIPIQP